MADSQNGADETPLWRYIPLNQFSRPAEPTPEVVRSWSREIWQRLIRAGEQSNNNGPEIERKLQDAPTAILERAAAEPIWENQSAEALSHCMVPWLQAPAATAGAQVVVGSPGTVTAAALQRWAADQDLAVIPTPTPAELLQGEAWLERWPATQGRHLVLPALERCFLRHYAGLDTIRQLLDRIWNEQLACVVGCDSWAWAYLCQALQTDAFFHPPLTLAPFDAPALEHWFAELSGGQEGRDFTFRQADSGRSVLSDDENPDDEFLKELAARSRGNATVAWAIWRHSLQVETDAEVGEKAQEAAAADRGYTIYVRPWHKLTLPQPSERSRGAEPLVLHALLLHGGLSGQLLAQLLPMPPSQISGSVQRLAAAGLIETMDDRWQVTWLGYPGVRALLVQEGFLVDAL